MRTTSDDDKEVEALPHQDNVVIDNLPDGDALLVHLITLERKKLPPGRWELEFSDDGFAIAVRQDTDTDPLVIEDWLDKVLCADKDGVFYIHQVGRQGTPSSSYSLSEKRSRYEELSCSIRMGPTGARCEISLFFMVWPRQGFRFYWNSTTLYKALGLSTYNSLPSKWAWTGWRQGWAAYLKKLGLWSDAVIGSARTVKEYDNADPADHCWPSISISTVAVVALLTRWCSASQKAGGFCNNLRRDAAEVLLASVLRSACSQVAFEVPLHFDDEWMFKWPRSEPLHPGVVVSVDKAGVVDLGNWIALVASSPLTSIAAVWLNKLTRSPFASGSQLSLKVMLACSFSAGLESLVRQLLFAVAWRVEMALFASLKVGARNADSFKVKTLDMWAVLGDRTRLGHELLKHVAASVRHSAGVRNLSRCADKANVGGRQLQAGIIAFPDGKASLAGPQVARKTARRGANRSLGGALGL